MINFDKLWQYAKNEYPPDPLGATGKLIYKWAEHLKSDIIEYSQEEDLAVFLLDLSKLMLKGLDVNILVVVQPPQDTEKERYIYLSLERLAENAATAHCLCFVIFLQDDILISKSQHPRLLDIVILSGDDLRKQFASPIPDYVLLNAIIPQVRIGRLCPFDTTRPARGGMFVGRHEELRQLIMNKETNYLVTGSRRVGKSSLIERVVVSLKKQNNLRDSVFFMICETWGSFKSSVRQIADTIDPKRLFRIELGSQNLLNLFKYNSKFGKKPLFIFFDEFDRIVRLESQQGWRLLKILHTASNMNWIRIVISGYRNVMKINELADSPFFGKLTIIRLPPLDKNDAIYLFTEPFNRVKIKIRQREKIEQKILDASACYPFMIQFYGEKIFNLIANNGRKEFFIEDIEKFEKSFEFDNFIIGHFFENTNTNERLIALVFAFSTLDKKWNESDFERELNNIKISLSLNNIREACRNLVLANIFEYYDGKYNFIFPSLKKQINRHWPNLDIKLCYERGEL